MFNTIKAIGEPQGGGVAHDMLASIHHHLSQPGVWAKGTPGPGRQCLSTAIAWECCKRSMNSTVSNILHRHVMTAVKTYMGGQRQLPEPNTNWIPGWNDEGVRTLHDVLAVLTIATLSAHEIDDEVIAEIGKGEHASLNLGYYDVMGAAKCAVDIGQFASFAAFGTFAWNFDSAGAVILAADMLADSPPAFMPAEKQGALEHAW